jgi:SAM-dependent methyltransferase
MPDSDRSVDPGDPDELDPAFYANGGISLSDEEQAALGDLHNKRVLVLGAGNGEDALSLVNLGAEVTVVDEAEAMVEAKALSQAARLPVRFVEGSPAAIPASLRVGGFDAAYAGFGGLGWVADLDPWITGIHEALEKGAALVVYDEHPVAFTVGSQDGQLTIAASYFGDQGSEDDADDEDAGLDGPEPNWTLGDIITAIGSHGFAIGALMEFHESERFATVLDDIEDVPEEYLACVPGVFLLVAHKL